MYWTGAKVQVAPVCAAWAITANRLVRADFEKLVGAFEEGLRKARPDALLLAMHGAQTAEGEDDVEGHVLSIARKVLGPDRPIVMSLDLHANITQRMVSEADAIVGYHTYPHVDMFEIGQKAARLMLRILKGAVQACDGVPQAASDYSPRKLADVSRSDVEADSQRAGSGSERKSRSSLDLPGPAVDGHR